MEQLHTFSLLLRTYLDPTRKVMDFGLLVILAPHLSFEDLNIEGSSSFSKIGLDYVLIELFIVIQDI